MTAAGQLPGVELRVNCLGLIVVWHTPRTLAALLTSKPAGQWVNLWPGVADEQVFHRCGSCGLANALPVAVQARRVQ